MLKASPAAQDLVASYNGGKVSAQGMTAAQNATKASTIGLTIAQTALNAAIGMGIGLVISLVTQGISKLIHANEEAIESAEELRKKYEDFKSTNASNISTLKGLEDEFDKLSKGVSQYGDNIDLTTEQYERYKEIIQQIVGMSPSLAEGYDTENGYIADKNGLLERAIELQEIEYRNELRKITNLENLKTSMSGYIAEYNDALHGGYITAEGNIIGTTIDTDFKNSLWQLFNTNNRENYDAQSMAKDIMESLGVENIDAEMQKYFNDYGYWQDSWFWNDYCDTIINNLNAVTDSLSFEEVGLDEEVFDQNLEKLGSYAESYRDMKDSVEMANDAIQTDLGYIAEYADGYSNLSTEQEKFVSDFLKGFDISDVATEDNFGKLKYDNNKMASVKNQIKDFVKDLSQDESTKKALSDLYAIPTDEQSISEYVKQFRTALDIIKAYCEENGIEIPIAITNKEEEINELEAQQQRAVDFAKGKFNGYDPTAFFKKHSINTKEEIDTWLEIAQAANSAAEAEKRYVQGSTFDNETTILSISDTVDQLNTKLKPAMDSLASAWKDIFSGENGKMQLDDIDLLSVADDIKSKLKELNDLGLSVDYSAYEDFIRVLEDTESTEGDVKDAFDSLAQSIVNASVSGAEDFETLKDSLEDLGVVNNEIVAFQSLIQNTKALEEAELDLANATEEQMEKFVFARVSTENYEQALNLLKIQQILCSENPLDSADSISQLLTLANAAGIAREYLDQLYNLQMQYDAADEHGKQIIAQKLIDLKQKVQSEFENAEVDYGGITKSAGESGKDAGDAYVEAFEKELSELQDLRDRGVIDEKEYLDRLRALYIRYFADRKEYLDEYNKYEHEYLTGMKSLYDSALSGITKLIGNKIDAVETEKETVISALEEEKESRLEVINLAKEQLQAQIDLIDEQIEAKQDIIDSIQDEIDKMREANEERKRATDLQKAQYELERMMNQRTQFVYQGGQMIYKSDDEGIRDAREAVDDAKLEIEIAAKEKEIALIEDEIDLLEKQKDAIKDQIDALDKQADSIEKYYSKMISQQEKYYDSLLKSMEEQKSKWEELAEVQEIAEAYAAVQQVFGELGYTVEDVLNGSSGAFEDFKEKYIGLMSDLNSTSSFADGLSYATDVAKEDLGSFLDKTQDVAQGLDDLSSKGEGLNAISNAMSSANTSASTLKTSTDGLNDNLSGISDSLTNIPSSEGINGWVTGFTELGEAIKGVAQVLGITEEGTVGSLATALQDISKVSLGTEEEGIIGQFGLLKKAVDDVSFAISGGGSNGGKNGVSGDSSNSKSASMSSGVSGEGASGLLGVIEEIGTKTNETLGKTSEEEGGSGAIGKFTELKNAVDLVTQSIGTGEEEEGEETTTLIGALQKQYEKAQLVLPEEKTLFD